MIALWSIVDSACSRLIAKSTMLTAGHHVHGESGSGESLFIQRQERRARLLSQGRHLNPATPTLQIALQMSHCRTGIL